MKKKLLLGAIALVAAAGLAGCGKESSQAGSEVTSADTSTPVVSTSVKEELVLNKLEINNKEELTDFFYVGDENRKVEVDIDEGKSAVALFNSGDIVMTSSNDSVIKVLNQYIMAAGKGKATVTVTGGGKTDSFEVLVMDAMSLVPEDTAVGVGQTMSFAVNYPKGGEELTNDSYNWSTSDDTIATVAGGVVTGVKVGTVTITATLKTDADQKAKFVLEVLEEVAQPVEISTIVAAGSYTARGQIVAIGTNSYLIDDGTGVIMVYAKAPAAMGAVVKVTGPVVAYHNILEFSGNITVNVVGYKVAAVTPMEELTATIAKKWESASSSGANSSAYMRKYSWDAFATMSNGYLCLNLAGYNIPIEPTAFDPEVFPYEIDQYYHVEAYYVGGAAAYHQIMVTKLEKTSPTETIVSLDITKATLEVEDSFKLTPNALIADADKDITPTWTSSDPEIATVENGVVTGVKAGTVTITYAIGEKSAAATIKVINKLEVTSSLGALTEKDTDYRIRATVASKVKDGYVLTDGTNVLYLQTNENSAFDVNDVIAFVSQLNFYNGMISIYNLPVALIDVIDGAVPAIITSTTEVDKVLADSWVTTGDTPVADYRKITYRTTVGKSGNYFTYNVEGSSTVIESYQTLANVTKPVKEGKLYNLTGYYVGYNTKYKYASVIITSLSEIAISTVDYGDTKSVLVGPGRSTVVPFTWSLANNETDGVLSFASEDETIATVSRSGGNLTINGIAEGETNVVATIKSADGSKTYYTSKLPVSVTSTLKATMTVTNMDVVKTEFRYDRITKQENYGEFQLDKLAAAGDTNYAFVANTEAVKKIRSVSFEVYGKYQNLKLALGKDSTGTDVTASLVKEQGPHYESDSRQAWTFTYSVEEGSEFDNFYLYNPSTYNVSLYTITVTYAI